MTDHIYGRENIIAKTNRPHMFIAELYLYIDYLKEQLQEDIQPEALTKTKKYHATFYQNLRDGIKYYKQLPGVPGSDRFIEALDFAELELDTLNYQCGIHKEEVPYL
jgi:hypothetical protein